MPSKAKRICNHPGCCELVDRGYCEKHKKQDRHQKQQRYDSRRQSSTERGYDSRWRKYREYFLRNKPLCVKCLEEGIVEPATVVDHIIPHKGDKDFFWDTENHQALCKRCHDIKTVIEDGGFGRNSTASHEELYPNDIRPSAIPLIIVCGPPASGKTTYVNDNKGLNDIVIDLDEIRANLSGGKWYQNKYEWYRPSILKRNMILRSLYSDSCHEKAWFIISAPTSNERNYWCDLLKPSKVIVIEASAEICKQRIKYDIRRTEMQNIFHNSVDKWWQQYQRRKDDVVIVMG